VGSSISRSNVPQHLRFSYHPRAGRDSQWPSSDGIFFLREYRYRFSLLSSMRPLLTAASARSGYAQATLKRARLDFARGFCRGTIVRCKDDFVGELHYRFDSAVVQYFLPGRMLDISNITRAFVAQFVLTFQAAVEAKKKKLLENVPFSWIEVYRGADLLIVGTNVGRSFIPRQRVILFVDPTRLGTCNTGV